MNVQSSAGQMSGTLTANLAPDATGTDPNSGSVPVRPRSMTGEVSVKHLDLSPILNNPQQKSDITATARFDLHGEWLSNVNALHGTASIDSPRLVAAGYVAERIHGKARVDGLGSELTCTRASLKQAPPPRSVSVSGTSAVPVA